MRENETVVLIGAGSAMFTRGLIADMLRQDWRGELRLVDIDPAALKVAEGLAGKMINASGSRLKLSAFTDRRKALPGATVVICTIGVGGRRAWEQDVFIPRKYGIYQPVGDSVMPGGSSRALRMIPAMVAIAKDVLELCPAALFFNYGNPMGPICRAIRKATGANVVGLCHGVFDVAKHLAKILEVDKANLKYTAVGMNHLTWFTQLRCNGADLMPRLLEIAAERNKNRPDKTTPLGRNFAEAGTADRRSDVPPLDNPFTWELTQLFGAFPAVMDRHITEFFPHMFFRQGSYYGQTLGVESYSFEKTIERGDRSYKEMSDLAASNDPLPQSFFDSIGGEHEQVIDIIESIRGDLGRTYSANLPNAGQVGNLPVHSIIECPAIADAGGIHPIYTGDISSGLAGTLATRLQWVETIVDAALEGSRAKFVQALVLDGAVSCPDIATKLADDLLKAQAAYLPQFA